MKLSMAVEVVELPTSWGGYRVAVNDKCETLAEQVCGWATEPLGH